MTPRRTALIATLLLSSVLRGEKPGFRPVPISDGPLLAFKQPKKNSDELALYLFDPALHKEPQILWQDRYHPNPRPLKRFAGKHLLVEFANQLHLAEIPTGKVAPLLPGKEQTKLISSDDNTIFFLQRSIPEKISDLGIGLTTGKDDKTVVEKYFRPRDFLFSYEAGGEKEAKKISPVAIELLLESSKDGFLVITAEQPQKVATINRKEELKEICAFDATWVATMTTHAFSPAGDYLALSVLGSDQDFHDERTLIVCDLKKNSVCFKDQDVPLGPSLFSGRSNFLDLTWRADHVLEYGGAFAALGDEEEQPRYVNVTTGRSLDKKAQSELPVIEARETPDREKKGMFDLKFGQVFFRGAQDPVASVLDDRGVGVRDLAIDSKGLWAAYSERKDDRLYVLDGKARKKAAVQNGWAHDLEWLEVESGK